MTNYHNQPSRHGTSNVELPADDYSPLDLIRIGRLARELRLTDQILSADLDTVSVVDSGPAPAWTSLTGDHVTFSMGHMPMPEGATNVAIWLGTNAHELGHVLYSPRKHSPLMQRVVAGENFMRGLAQLHNIMEDQRQERLLLAKFSPWRGYLTAALSHHLVADAQGAWLLMAGRTWLPANVRSEARARFVIERGESQAREVEALVGDYQRLADPGDTEADEAWAILDRLYQLFDVDMPRLPTPCVVIASGDPDASGEAFDSPDLPAAADEAGQGGGASDGDDDAATNDGDADGDGTGQADGDDDGDGTGATDGSSPGPFNRDRVRRQLRAGAERQLKESDVKGDLDAVLDSLDHGSAGLSPEGDTPQGHFDPASDAAKRLHRQVADALLDLKDQSEPGWVRRVEGGRLNVRRVLTGSEADVAFDRYTPGQMDASEMEVVLLLDVSISMRSQERALAEAAWAIRRSVDDLEGRCTTITWNDQPHQLLAGPDVRPDDRMFVPKAEYGTNPATALSEAFKVLADSPARHRLLVILTDGEWAGGARNEALIGAMGAEGITTVLAHLKTGTQVGAINGHGCRHAEAISRPHGLADLFRQVAAEKIGSWR